MVRQVPHVNTRNGVTVAYWLGAVNSGYQALNALELHLAPDKNAIVAGFVNAAIVAIARTFILPYRLSSPASEAGIREKAAVTAAAEKDAA